ncbi:hypothetical protein WJX74_008224 [Apatococcus lobatus]|uniref:UvrD-like helicase C-terminal domain-containing protein n=1 Tax=Apatococcus lobatus TaxID=904363 RepID=A0AAW1R1U6_9CHLO
MDGLKDEDVDFPFRVSPSEQRIIELDSPSSIILVGRSGTGKTTCAVYRIWAQWFASRSWHEPANQVFITASATLRLQVAKAFRKLQAAVIGLEQAAELEKAAEQEIHTLSDVPTRLFPLFLSTRAYLWALDATLPEPFLARHPNGSLRSSPVGDGDAEGTLEVVEMDMLDTDDDNSSEASSAEEHRGDMEHEGAGQPSPDAAKQVEKQELSFVGFQDIWTSITTKEQRHMLRPTLVYQEILSYIKGSREALETEAGHLSLDQYLAVGKKRAPNFSQDDRRRVYPVFEAYNHYLRSSRFGKRQDAQYFDTLDLVAYILVPSISERRLPWIKDCLPVPGRSAGLHSSRASAGLADPASVVLPDIEHLHINYRTHSGIMDVAASVVNVIRFLFPMQLDKLAREEAFFPGPKPMLLTALQLDDLAILLGGSARASSQVEYGAHQVVLTRGLTKKDNLPAALQQSRALVMTVPQAKGLEFDDVFLLDFFADSPANAEWRVLLHYLEEQVPEHASTAEGNEDLRPLRFDPVRHVILCEELKHLYTAITRAKNNVIIFDSNAKKRAPFFQYLKALGLARVVKSLLKDGQDASIFSLKQVKDPNAEWCRRGINLLDNRLFGHAQQCFEKANDAVHGAAAWAIIEIQRARKLSAVAKKACMAQDVDQWAASAATEYYEKANFRFAYLTAKQIRDDALRTNLFKRMKLWRALAEEAQSPLEAAQILMANGDVQGAAYMLQSAASHNNISTDALELLHAASIKINTLTSLEQVLSPHEAVQTTGHRVLIGQALLQKADLISVEFKVECAQAALDIFREEKSLFWEIAAFPSAYCSCDTNLLETHAAGTHLKKLLQFTEESMIDLAAPLARSAAARKRLRNLESSLGVLGLCDNLPGGVSYKCSSSAFCAALAQGQDLPLSPHAGASTQGDFYKPWSQVGRLASFQRTVDRATACRAVSLSLADHSLKAVLALAEQLFRVLPSWQTQLDSSDTPSQRPIQQLLLLALDMLAMLSNQTHCFKLLKAHSDEAALVKGRLCEEIVCNTFMVLAMGQTQALVHPEDLVKPIQAQWMRLSSSLQQWARDAWKAALAQDLAARNRNAILMVWRCLSFICRSSDSESIWMQAAASRSKHDASFLWWLGEQQAFDGCMLVMASKAFAGCNLKDGCGLILRFLSRCLDAETDSSIQLPPEYSMTLQAFLELLEVVTSVAVPGLNPTVFMPSSLVNLQEKHRMLSHGRLDYRKMACRFNSWGKQQVDNQSGKERPFDGFPNNARGFAAKLKQAACSLRRWDNEAEGTVSMIRPEQAPAPGIIPITTDGTTDGSSEASLLDGQPLVDQSAAPEEPEQQVLNATQRDSCSLTLEQTQEQKRQSAFTEAAAAQAVARSEARSGPFEHRFAWRGVDGGDQHALSTQAERAAAVQQEGLALLDKLEEERQWTASEVDFGHLQETLNSSLKEMRACLDDVKDRRFQTQQEQLNQFAVLAGARESGTGHNNSLEDIEGASDEEIEDIMVKAQKSGASKGGRKRNKKKGKGGTSGKGRR